MENNNNSLNRKNQNLDELTVEELMIVAKQKIKTGKNKRFDKKISRVEEIKQFIVAEGIKSHTSILIPSVLIYDRYFKWCQNNNVNPIALRTFSTELSKIFIKKNKANTAHFYLNPEGFLVQEYESIKNKYK